MLFKTTLTIPANTSKSSPAKIYHPVARGVITAWFVGFPPGCAGLVHVAIYRHERRILPEGAGDSLYWNDLMFHIRESFEIAAKPYELRVEGWSDDDSYEHRVFVGVEMQKIPEETTESLLQRLLTALVGG